MLRISPVSFSVVHVLEVQQIESVVYDDTIYQWGDREWMSNRAQTNPLKS